MSLLSVFRRSKAEQETAAIADYIVSWMNYHSPFIQRDTKDTTRYAHFGTPSSITIRATEYGKTITIENYTTGQKMILEDVPRELIKKIHSAIADIRANNVKIVSLQDVKDILG